VVDYRFLWGTVYIVMGVFFAIFGRKLFKAALFIGGALIFTTLSSVIFYSTFLNDTSTKTSWIVICSIIVVGMAVGFVISKFEKFGAIILGALGGYTCGVLLNDSVAYLTGSIAVVWSINILCAIVAAVVAWKFFDKGIIFATSLIGSFFIMRGIGLYIGGFPNEHVLMAMIRAGVMNYIPSIFYAYLAGIIVLTVIASHVQLKQFNEMDNHEKIVYNTEFEA